jgi:hypothetical protein
MEVSCTPRAGMRRAMRRRWTTEMASGEGVIFEIGDEIPKCMRGLTPVH